MTTLFNQSNYTARRKLLRNNPTKTEKQMWEVLKSKKLDWFKFRRQYGIGRYVIDFFCVQKKLTVEIDGEVHNSKDSKEYEIERDEFIKGFGIKAVKFRNEDIERDINKVLTLISKELI